MRTVPWLILGIDPGPQSHGAVIYNARLRRVEWSSKAADTGEIHVHLVNLRRQNLDLPRYVIIERPAAMGTLGPGIVGHMLDTAYEAGKLHASLQEMGHWIETMTRREVLRSLGVLSGKGSSDSKVRAACIADHQVPGGPLAVGRKANPGPLYGVSSHAWQALGLVLAWLEVDPENLKHELNQGGEQ